MKLVIRTLEYGDGGVVWYIDEEESEVVIPKYDGSDTQSFVLELTDEQAKVIEEYRVKIEKEREERFRN